MSIVSYGKLPIDPVGLFNVSCLISLLFIRDDNYLTFFEEYKDHASSHRRRVVYTFQVVGDKTTTKVRT